jgi:hemerythrin-like domain-containing protein
MCSYCGCQAITVVGRFTAEHEAIINATGHLRRAAATGNPTSARAAAQSLADLLSPHTRSEERSLFTELRLDPEFTDHVDALCAEHRTIDTALEAAATGNLDDVTALESLLRRHIDKEENGLFPAAAIALDGPAWERVVERA